MDLLQGLEKELARNREILEMYKEIPTGVFGATMIQMAIDKADKAIADGDVVAMMAAYSELKETE